MENSIKCLKICFDKRTAQTILNQCKKEHRNECRIYFHEECQAWHLTSSPEYEEVIPLKEEELIFCELWKKLKEL